MPWIRSSVGAPDQEGVAVHRGHLEREMQRVPAPELLAGGIGLLIGMIMASLLSIPMFHLPLAASHPTVAFAYATFGYGGFRIGGAKTEELFAVFGVKPRAAGARRGEVMSVDVTNALQTSTGRLVFARLADQHAG
jgi:uncharacterized protein YacL